ncbi:MAG: aminoacetone oxidase family FAD-binding enzyme, partial [Spirochaetota bacterium]
MMAAGRAAACGAATVLLEKNKRLGRKLLISGGGRCNVTTGIVDRHLLVARYGTRAAGLHSPFSRFDSASMRAFLHERGLETKMEAEQRVFPVTDQAASVRAVLERYLDDGHVRVRTRADVSSIRMEADRVAGIVLRSGEVVPCGALVLATGGVSRPETGSTGDGFRWLAETGHTVRVPRPSLVPIAVRERWPATLQGLALPHVKLTAVLDGTVQFAETGKLLFTHFGLSGPLVLNLSQRVGELAQGGPVELRIDLVPSTDGGTLERELQEVFDATARRKIRNSLGTVLPPRLVTTVLELAGVDGELEGHSVTRAARK